MFIIKKRYFLQQAGMTINFDLKRVSWLGRYIFMKNVDKMVDPKELHNELMGKNEEERAKLKTGLDQFLSQIQGADYKAINTDEIARQQKHLTKL